MWYSHLDIENVLQDYGSQFKPKLVKRTDKTLAKARTKDSMTAFSKLTHVVDGKTRIVDQSPLIVPIEQLAAGRGARRDRSRGFTNCCATIVRRSSSTAGCCSRRSS